jgi:hypothetical protein
MRKQSQNVAMRSRAEVWVSPTQTQSKTKMTIRRIKREEGSLGRSRFGARQNRWGPHGEGDQYRLREQQVYPKRQPTSARTMESSSTVHVQSGLESEVLTIRLKELLSSSASAVYLGSPISFLNRAALRDRMTDAVIATTCSVRCEQGSGTKVAKLPRVSRQTIAIAAVSAPEAANSIQLIYLHPKFISLSH